MPQPLQPFLHELVVTLAAPTQVLSQRSGDISSSVEGSGAQGVIHADVRVISQLALTVGGRSAEHLSTVVDASTATFTGVLRHLTLGAHRDEGPDPQLRLDRHRSVTPGSVAEELVLSSVRDEPVVTTARLVVGSDLAPIEQIKVGAPAGAPHPPVLLGEQASWQQGSLRAALTAPGATLALAADRTLLVEWSVVIPRHGSATLGWSLQVEDPDAVVVAPTTSGLDVDLIVDRVAASLSRHGRVEPRLGPWLRQSLADLNQLRMSTAAHPADSFFAAGAPWYLTLFGRDSLWTSRLLLPVDVEQAAGTLRTLARLAGTRLDPGAAEEPGKIPHELRRGRFTFGTVSLPPLYYGTIDATPLWVCLLHDAWRGGLDPSVVTELLPTLEAALGWLVGYVNENGFLAYVDASGSGLANQGWKDSADAVRFADGSLADPPVALCEVQGYAHEAAVSGAAILDAFGREGGDRYRAWAADLATRFRASFWCGATEGGELAMALDGHQRRVDSATSNAGHVIGTGILSVEEERHVARRLTAADLDSGLGLRTMSSADAGYSPLSYHCGSVWPHDTAVVIAAMTKAGLTEHAAGLAEGLLRASMAFDRRLPELWSGEGRPVPYAAACRPQAWSAAAAVTVATALTGDRLRA